MDFFVYVGSLFFIGYVLKWFSFPDNFDKSLHLFILYISLPCTIFLQIPKLDFDISLLRIVLVAWSSIALGIVFVYFLSKLIHFSKKSLGALYLIVPLYNSSFLGFPIIEHYFGATGVGYAVIYDQFGSFLALSIYGSVISSIYGHSSSHIDYKSIFKKVITFPPFIALMIALVVDIKSPLLQPLSNFLLPLSMIAIGFRFTFYTSIHNIKILSVVLPFKLIIVPLILILIFNINSDYMRVAVMESSMSPMFSVAAIVSIFALDKKLTSCAIGYGVLLSFFTTYYLFHYIF